MNGHRAPRQHVWRDAVAGLGVARSNMIVLAVVCIGLAQEMQLQPLRFTRTPAYGNLLALLPIEAWGWAYAVAAVLLVAAVLWPSLALYTATFTFTLTLLAVWWLIFLVRRVTDISTTDVNLLNWGVLLYLAARAAWIVTRHQPGEGK